MITYENGSMQIKATKEDYEKISNILRTSPELGEQLLKATGHCKRYISVIKDLFDTFDTIERAEVLGQREVHFVLTNSKAFDNSFTGEYLNSKGVYEKQKVTIHAPTKINFGLYKGLCAGYIQYNINGIIVDNKFHIPEYQGITWYFKYLLLQSIQIL